MLRSALAVQYGHLYTALSRARTVRDVWTSKDVGVNLCDVEAADPVVLAWLSSQPWRRVHVGAE